MIDHFLFDLDGTVTREELLPRIARAVGLEREISELTRMTIRGEVPFEYSLRHRVQILSQVPVSQVQDIVASVAVDPHILDFLHRHRDRCTIVTGNLDVWLAKLAPSLGVPIRSSTAATRGDLLTGLIEVMDKGAFTRHLQGSLCAIGDGHNDLEMLQAAAVSVAFGGVHAPATTLLEVATHAIFDASTLCRFLSRL